MKELQIIRKTIRHLESKPKKSIIQIIGFLWEKRTNREVMIKGKIEYETILKFF